MQPKGGGPMSLLELHKFLLAKAWKREFTGKLCSWCGKELVWDNEDQKYVCWFCGKEVFV